MNHDQLINNMIAYAETLTGSERYRGLCLCFIEDALEQSNGLEIFGGDSAKQSYELSRDGVQTGIPERGAFVFYDILCLTDDGMKDYGHCGISLGDGKVIHAWDQVRVDWYLEVEALSFAGESPKYLGWVSIERVLAQQP